MPATEQDWQSFMVAAASGKFGPEFPDGKLSELETSCPSEGVTQRQWYWEPTEGGGMAAIEIDIYSGDAMEMYKETKKECETRQEWREEADGWKEWPSGFPDKNDYEDVEICGMTSKGTKVAWVQRGFLIMISTAVESTDGEKLKDYADGVWNVVNKANEK